MCIFELNDIVNNIKISSAAYQYCYGKSDILNLTFRGPCIVIYSYNKTNKMH